METILDMGMHKLPAFTSEEKDIKAPLELCHCSSCNLIQLKHTVRPDLLWNQEYGYRSGVNEAIRADLAEIVSEGSKAVNLRPGDLVVDIGANDGTLLSNYASGTRLVGFEPSGNVASIAAERLTERAGFTIVNDFFNIDSYTQVEGNNKAKIVTAISMFYDLEDPNEFLQDARKVLANDGIFIIQQNYLVGMLQNCAFDNICHEHLEYYSLTSLVPLLERNDLEIIDVTENNINGGSFRTYIRSTTGTTDIPGGRERVEQMLQKEMAMQLHTPQPYLRFADKVNRNGHEMRDFIEAVVTSGSKVYVYGASTRGGTILQHYGLDNRLLTAAVERNPAKWGKTMSTGNIPIISEEQARSDQPDYMLILPWFFTPVFTQREKEYLKRGGRFIVPLPYFHTIGYEDISS